MILNINSNNNFVLENGNLRTNDNSKFAYSISSEMLTLSDLSTKKQILFPDHIIDKNSSICDLLLNSNIEENISTKIVLTDIKFDLIFITKGQISILDDADINE